MSLWQRWKKISLPNKLMIYMTAILASATTLYTCSYQSQARLLHQSAEQSAQQTDRLIAASERIANATVEALNEGKRANEEIVNRAERTAKAAESVSNTAVRQANSSQELSRAAGQTAQTSAKAFVIGSGTKRLGCCLGLAS